jgi:hypothetical protein
VRLSARGLEHSTPHCDPVLFGLPEYEPPFTLAEIREAQPREQPIEAETATQVIALARAEVSLSFWPRARHLVRCPWCGRDCAVHATSCARPQIVKGARDLLLADLRECDLEALKNYVVLAASEVADHYWIACRERTCGALVHLRKPPRPTLVTYFERVKPLAGEQPIAVRAQGLAVADWAALENHTLEHRKKAGWW